jgi:hypothetical protein
MKIAFVGHSHINSIARGRRLADATGSLAKFVQLRNPRFIKDRAAGRSKFENFEQAKIEEAVVEATSGAALAVLCPTGNEHFIACMLQQQQPGGDEGRPVERLETLMKNYGRWFAILRGYVRAPAAVLPPVPPIESAAHILANPGKFAEKLKANGVPSARLRLLVWRRQLELIREMAQAGGVRFLELPAEVISEDGYLREQFRGEDPTHGNEEYGAAILRHIIGLAASPATSEGAPGRIDAGPEVISTGNSTAQAGARAHPYAGLPDRAFWKQAVAQVPVQHMDPVGQVPFRISRSDRVATAGSCFAQHISKRIRSAGFQFLVTEQPPEGEPGDGGARGFYDFSARYGNLYTARQLVQLFDRAFGYFSPLESYWTLPRGRFCDPFRPRIEPDGFASVEALLADRQRHLAAVKDMFLRLDVLVFTLGLTECWISRLDGAAFPLAPGVAGGEFDSSRHEFVNFSVDDVVSDLRAFIRKLRLVNPGARLLLTVSPVPLAATYEPGHVLVSTTYSKSVLRVAADTVSRSHDGVCYFPSFEVIAGHYNRGRYFGQDLRSVTEEGVDHVMSVFMRHLTDAGAAGPGEPAPASPAVEEMVALAEAACDEELLERK